MARQTGDTLLNGQYRILRLLGRGGFGFVYHAHDTQIGEQVAIKELIPGLVGDEETLKRFLAEARATMRLTHKRIVRTCHVFPEGSNYYIVMEYMPGGSLEERLRQQMLRAGGSRRSLPAAEAVRIAADVCDGLACAHEEGVVHCDLKPANILFDARGAAKVADFGIAHVSGEMLTRSWHTPAGFVAGTLPYMSPEQADGVRDDPRIDVYALGAVLYRMLTGHTYLDFDQRETPGAQADNVYRIRNQRPQPPRAHDPRLPDWLDGVVLRALAKRPEERHAGAEAMRAALVQPQAVAAPAASAPPLRPAGEIQDSPTPASPYPAALQTPAGAVARPVGAAKSKASLPVWFWAAAGASILLFLVLLLAVALQDVRNQEPTIVPETVAGMAVESPTPRTSASTGTPAGVSGRVISTLPLSARQEPRSDGALTAYLNSGTAVQVRCRTTGDPIEGEYTWYYVTLENRRRAYVAARWVELIGATRADVPVCDNAMVVGTATVVTPTGVPPATATLSPTGAAGVALTPAFTAEPGPAASPGPSLGAVTLLAPTNGVILTGLVTFTWSLDPGPLAEGCAFWLFIGQGDPPDLRDRNLNTAPPHRELQQIVDLDASLTESGDYYWTVVIVELWDDDRALTEPTYRSFRYPGPATPSTGG